MRKEVMKKACVVGVGVIGPGVAQCLTQAFMDVVLVDIAYEILSRAKSDIESTLNLFIKFGLTSEKRSREFLDRISMTTNLEDAAEEADFVIEAVPENLQMKKDVFRHLDKLTRKDTILASNTSSLNIDEIADVTSRPEKVLVMHWMNPPPIMPIVEVVMGKKTSKETVRVVLDIIRKAGKKPILLKKVIPGYLLNRMNAVIAREALHMVEEGVVSKEDIDTIFKEAFGPRFTLMGPFEILDLFGLDTWLAVSKYLNPDLCSFSQPAEIVERMVQSENLGLKTGRGFYDYAREDPKKEAEKVKEKLLERFVLLKKVAFP